MFCYLTSTPVYEARSELLVQQTGPVLVQTGATDENNPGRMLPTYERLFQNDVVLRGAASRIERLPKALRVDMSGKPRSEWPEMIRRRLSAKTVRMTQAIEIFYRSRSPQAAEAVVHTIVDSYLAFMEQYHRNVAEEIVDILQTERKQVAQRLSQKEQELLRAHRDLGDIGLRDGAKLVHPLVERAIKINESLMTVQQNRLRQHASLVAVQTAVQKGEDVRQHLLALDPLAGREMLLAALGLGPRDMQLVAELDQQLINDRAQLATLQQHYGDRHPQVAQLHQAIEKTQVYLASYQQQADRRIQEVTNRRLGEMLVDMLKQELSKLAAHERELQIEYERAHQEAVALHGKIESTAIIEAEVERLRDLNNTLISRIESIDINQNQPDVRVEVVDPPVAADRPVSPRPLVVLAVSLFSGLGIGFVVVYARDILDDRFRSPEELKHQLQCNLLAMVRQLPTTDRVAPCGLQVHVAPDSIESEAFRTLRTTLAFTRTDLSCVAVSSAEPGDGKTTVLANLGVSFSQIGKRTLIIDADLRRPGLTNLFAMRGKPGLSDVLRSTSDIATVATTCTRSTAANLDILPSGSRPLDPTGLLASDRFSELLAWAQENYEQILIDSAPMLAVSDATIVGKVADGLMLVIQPAKNHRRLVLRTVEEIRAAGINLVGVVINRISPDSSQQFYGGYGYGYGYGPAYGETANAGSPAQQAA
jgi:capsular exopolysaccharide synthesis family protein